MKHPYHNVIYSKVIVTDGESESTINKLLKSSERDQIVHTRSEQTSVFKKGRTEI